MTGGRAAGKVVLVTGGARGIGEAIAVLLAAEGARVVVGDVLGAEGRRVVQEVRHRGGHGLFHPLDVTREDQWDRAIAAAVDAFGGLDVLVNNAGVGQQLAIEDTDEAVWRQTMDVNVTGAFLGTRHAIPEMRSNGAGSVVNISSMSGLVGGGTSAAYHASKGAIRLLTKATAVQYARDRIRANSVHPGVIETPMTRDFLADPGNRGDREARTPLGRIGTPEDVAYGVLYLASDESSFVTGSELVIDGGRTAV